jgi:hypothetical protein
MSNSCRGIVSLSFLTSRLPTCIACCLCTSTLSASTGSPLSTSCSFEMGACRRAGGVQSGRGGEVGV